MEGKRVQKPEPVAASCNGFLFWESPDRLPEGGIYVPGRISRDFDVFLAPRPPWSLGAGLIWKQKGGYGTPKPAANGCNGSFFGKPRTDCRKGKSTSSEEFRGISTFSSEDTAVVGRIRANRPVRNTGLRQRRDKLCSGSRCFPGTVDKREESFYDK